MKYYKVKDDTFKYELKDINGKIGKYIKTHENGNILLKFDFDHPYLSRNNNEFKEKKYKWFKLDKLEKVKVEYNKVTDNIKPLFNLRELL